MMGLSGQVSSGGSSEPGVDIVLGQWGHMEL
jgi:hypothetical protein